MKNKIFVFTSVHRWNDIRIFQKESISLAKKYNIEFHAPADFKYKKVNGIEIFGLPLWKKVSERKDIRKELWKRIKNSDAEVFHFHDPELIFMGIYLKIFKRKKVIYDVHENVAKQIINKDYIPTLLLKRIISFLYRIIEFAIIILFDNIVVAGDDILKNFYNKIVLNNYPIINPNNRWEKIDKDNTISYLGGVSRIRGAEEIARAFQIINYTKKYNIKLKIIGRFEDNGYENYFLKKYKECVSFLGWKSPSEAYEEVSKSLAGIVLYLPIPNHMNLRSNKVFEYMECRVPIIYSDFPDWKRKLNKLDVGLAVNPKDPMKIAEAITYLLENPEKADQMGRNGRNAVKKIYNWNIEEEKMFKMYERLLSK
ncbi:MAG: glycosyltransferase [Candidatus Cloacimonadota bacterium]|nr:glycosyltransferase [Candidatus Cloacimonadota bacterium]